MFSIIREMLRLFLRHPVSFLLQVWETIEGWLVSREWKRIGVCLVPVCVASVFPCIVLIGYLRSQQSLLVWYVNAFQNAEAGSGGTNVEDLANPAGFGFMGETEEKGLSAAEIAARRLLQLQPGNEISRYYVAEGLRKKGQLVHARQMMSELAPEDRVGYPKAHAWMVNDMISSSQRNGVPIAKPILVHHISAACKAVDINPQMSVLNSNILESNGNIEAALKELEKAAGKDPKHWLDVARFAHRNQKKDLATNAARNGLYHFSGELDRVSSSTKFEEVEVLRSQIAMCHVFLNEYDKAIDVLMAGLRNDQRCAILRVALSNAYLFRYQHNLDKYRDPLKIGLQDLEQAMFWNPANTAAADVVSQLMAFQRENRKQIADMLRKQISEGRGVALTHILLANESILQNDLDSALPHLEIAHLHFPNALIVLNNLALVLATKIPPNLSRAEALIDRAIELGGESEELLDSRGQIYAKSGRILDAIRSYEKAISIAPSRVRTRERLIELYSDIGMQDMIAPQQKAISDIRHRLKAMEKQKLEMDERERQGNIKTDKSMQLFCFPPEEGLPPAPSFMANG